MTWADSDYGYKKKITIDKDKVAGDETDFPVLISVTDEDLADTGNGGHVQSSNGYDIVFYDSLQATVQDHEIESYTNTDGTLVFWVKVDSLSSTADTVIWVYYGKSGVTVDPSTTDTWDSNFMAVWHMADLTDSTTNGVDLTNNNADSGQSGKIGNCYGFVAADGNNYLSHATFLDTMPASEDLTLECWAKHGADAGDHSYFAKDNITSEDRFLLRRQTATDYLHFTLEGQEDGTKTVIDTVATTDNVWHYQVGVIEGDAVGKIYRDTNLTTGADTVPALLDGTDHDFEIGRWYSGVFYMDGYLDEMRVSSAVRDANWVSTTHETENDPDNFMDWGDESTPLVVNFTGTPLSGDATLTVQFTDSTSGGLAPYTYSWDIDNDSVEDYSTENPSHDYDTAGTYSVKLTITDTYSDSGSKLRTDYITVTEAEVAAAAVKKGKIIHGLKPSRHIGVGRIGS